MSKSERCTTAACRSGIILAVLAAFACFQIEVGFAQDCETDESPIGEACPGTDPVADSRCWMNSLERTGFPLKLDLFRPFGPGDFPPRSLDPAQSSSPLVSREVQHFRGPNPHRERPTHHGVLDLITGQPLLQAIDFELPFGGAVFRHVRTYSENAADFLIPPANAPDPQVPEGTFWDWNGMYWMMSENPIFLIDASYEDIVYPDQKRCYFIPDAHHAIPFLYDEVQGEYFAPPWFDAVLEHNGDGTNPPTQFVVYLNRKTIRYTIEAHYEDGGFWFAGMNIHAPPSEGGFGTPHYGLVTKIEDRYGNSVEYEYCPTVFDSSGVTPASFGCIACFQNCNEKGQIRSVKLRTASDEVAWTLLYTHRAFDPPFHVDEFYNDLYSEKRSRHALHSIHVYDWDVTISNTSCLTIGSEEFCIATTIDELDAITHPSIPGGWAIEARYFYSEFRDSVVPPSADGPCPAIDLVTGAQNGLALNPGYLLLKSTVTRRTPSPVVGGADTLEEQYNVYRYAGGAPTGDVHSNDSFQLTDVLDSSSIRAILDAKAQEMPQDQFDVNFLLQADQNVTVLVTDPVTGSQDSKKISELSRYHSEDRFAWEGGVVTGGIADSLIQFMSGDVSRTHSNNTGRRKLRVSGKGDKGGSYIYYYFLKYPDAWTDLTGPDWGAAGPFTKNNVTTLHYPYRVPKPGYASILESSALNEPFFITVIDELQEDDETGYDPILGTGMVSRRIVDMGAAGFVLRDRSWSFENGTAGPVTQVGSAQDFKFDCKGRIIQRRSKGWDVAAAGAVDETSEGLIEVFEYEDPCCTWSAIDDACDCVSLACVDATSTSGELMAMGIKRGSGETNLVYYTKRFEREAHDGLEARPELITKEVVFPDPVLDLFSPGNETTYEYVYADEPVWDEIMQRTLSPPIVAKTIVSPPSALTAGGPVYYPVKKALYDENGSLEWAGAGSLLDPSDVLSANEFYVNYTQRDFWGRPVLEVRDADPNLYPYEGGWQRISADGTNPLNLATTYEYYSVRGLRRVVSPNGREMRIAYTNVSGVEGVFRWAFKDLIVNGTDPFVTTSPVTITHLDGGDVISEKQVLLTDTDTNPDGRGIEANGASQELISTKTPEYDAEGRVTGVESAGADGTSISAGIFYNGFGQIDRQQDPDGTITRYVYDELGRVQSVYRGTNDEHEFWSTAVTCAAGEDPEVDNCYDANAFPDNMFLTEKRYYGTGVTDSDKLVEVRHYRDQPLNPYFEEPLPAGEEPPGYTPPPDNNEDDIGWIERIEYDWRMRPVWATRSNEFGSPLGHTLQWYDNLNRVRFVAEYGAAAPTLGSAADPRALGADSAIPDAAAILSATPKPVSLTELIYNKRGLVHEVLRYDVNDPSSYTSALTYYGYHDKPLEVHSPGAPTMKYAYDAKGRRITSSTFAGDVQVARTETVYDADDRAIKTQRFERKHGAPDTPFLGALNGVSSHVHTWYDLVGRVIATANYGTNNSDPVFWGNESPPYNPEEPPVTKDGGQVIAIDPTKLTPAGGLGSVLVTGYAYDNAGRQSAVFHPDGSASLTEFDDLGRMLLSTEESSATAPDPGLKRQTAYLYDDNGRLSKMAAVTPGVVLALDVNWGATDGSVQVTEFVYGGTIVDSGGGAVSAHNAWISEVRFPDPSTGAPSASADLTLTYYSDGAVATRTDANGNVLSFTYDELGRATQIDVDDSGWYTLAAQADPENLPDGRVQTIYLTYESDGLLQTVTTAGVVDGTSGAYIAESQFAYDDFRNLTNEWQAHRGPVNTGSSPSVDYTWAFSPNTPSSYNFNRLIGLAYPARPESGGGRRVVSFDYGDNAGGTDSRLSRITAINDSALGVLAGYDHIGTSRRLSTTLGNGVTQTFHDGTKYTGLDRFGRIADLHFTDAAGQTIHRYQYGYDLASNRTHARVTQWPTADGTVPHDNDRSWLYQYDGLNRLLSATRGQLTTGNDAIDPAGPAPEAIDWKLDGLGNWSAGPPTPPPDSDLGSSLVRSTGTAAVERQHHTVNRRNEIESVWTWSEASSPGFPDGYTRTYLQDPNGNLITDGLFVYQYDAFNRLIQVNLPGNVVFSAADGWRIESGLLGSLILRYSYDAFGRLIRKYVPLQSEPDYQTEDHYYDGVRRIQTIGYRFEDPNGPGFGTGGGTFGEGEGGLQEIELEPIPLPPVETAWTEREYVYGPGYVDEFVCEISPPPSAGEGEAILYFLQDANYNVVALTDETGTITEQRVFEPYGELAAGETFCEHAVSRVGHQGLFFERIDAAVNQAPIAPGALGFYYNRNRMYSPTLGRFLQRDPNATALPIVTALASNGQALNLLLSNLNPNSLFGDGMNLYEYVGSNPITSRDPSGLDEFDDAINDLKGQNAAALTYIADASGMALVGIQTTLTIVGAILGYDFFQAGFNIVSGNGSLTDVITVGATIVGGAVAHSFIRGLSKLYKYGRGRATAAATISLTVLQRLCFTTGTLVATSNGDLVPIQQLGLKDVVLSKHDGHDSGASLEANSRGAGPCQQVHLRVRRTHDSVMDIHLLRPLSWINATRAKVGSEIELTLPEMGIHDQAVVLGIEPEPGVTWECLGAGVVTGLFVTTKAEVVDLCLEGLDEPIGTTATHPFWSLDRGDWTAAGDLRVGEALLTVGGGATVAGIRPRSDRHTVYNLEVHQDHTFFVSEARVWVHNSCEFLPARIKHLFGVVEGGVGYLAPDGTAYVATMHRQVRHWLNEQGLWRTTMKPGQSGWYEGFVNNAGKFVGDLMD